MSALLSLMLLSAPAHATVGSEWGGLVNGLINGVGMRCGQVANIVQNVDPGWECDLVGVDNTIDDAVTCVLALNDACEDVGDRDDDLDGYTRDDGDCDDDPVTGPDVNPGAVEVCDGVDNDCSGSADINATDGTTYYRDLDQDGFGDPDGPRPRLCDTPGPVFSTFGGDCDDDNDAVYPTASEVCDGLDNDCSGEVDDACTVDCGGASAYVGDLVYDDTVSVCESGAGVVVVGSVEVDPTASDLSGLYCVCGVSGDLRVEGSAVSSLEGLSALSGVGQRVVLDDNDSLTSLAGWSAVAAESLTLINNDALVDFSGVGDLALSGDLVVLDNPALVSLDGAGSLTAGGLWIEGNDALVDLDGLSGLSALTGDLDLIQNALLSDISGLSWLTSVAGDLTLYRNPSLSTADADALAYDTLGEANIGGAVTIGYNAE